MKLELELIQKGADSLKASIDYSGRLELRICELESKVRELEERFKRHINTESAHEI